MRSIPFLLLSTSLLGEIAGIAAQSDPPPPKIESAQPFIHQLCKHLSSTNPRVRYTVREALRNLGRQTIPALEAARNSTQDTNVKAFITRTLGHVKLFGWRRSGKMDTTVRKNYMAALRNRPHYDIDRIARDINLTFDQIARLDPILRRHFKEMDALWQELRDAGALKDKEAYRDLNDEIKHMVEKAEPKLRAFLDAKQTEHVKRLMLRLRYRAVKSAVTEQLRNGLRAKEEELRRRMEALKAEWKDMKEQAKQGEGKGK